MSFNVNRNSGLPTISIAELQSKFAERKIEAANEPLPSEQKAPSHKIGEGEIPSEHYTRHDRLAAHKRKKRLSLSQRQKECFFKYGPSITKRQVDIDSCPEGGELKHVGRNSASSEDQTQIANKGVFNMSSYDYAVGLNNFKGALTTINVLDGKESNPGDQKVENFVSNLFSQLFSGERYFSATGVYTIKNATVGFDKEALKDADEPLLLSRVGDLLHNRSWQIANAKSSEEVSLLTGKAIKEVASAFSEVADLLGSKDEELKNSYQLLRGAVVLKEAAVESDSAESASEGSVKEQPVEYDFAPVEQLLKTSQLFVKNVGFYSPFFANADDTHMKSFIALKDLGEKLFPQSIYSKEGLAQIVSANTLPIHRNLDFKSCSSSVRNYILNVALTAKREGKELDESAITSIQKALNEHYQKMWSLNKMGQYDRISKELHEEKKDLEKEILERTSSFEISQMESKRRSQLLQDKVNKLLLLKGDDFLKNERARAFGESRIQKLEETQAALSFILDEMRTNENSFDDKIEQLKSRKSEVEQSISRLNSDRATCQKANFYSYSYIEGDLSFSPEELLQWKELVDNPKIVADFASYISTQLLELENALPKQKGWLAAKLGW